MWRPGPIGWGAFQSGDLTVRPLLPTGADKEGDVHSTPPLLLVPITWVTHHQTPRHTPAFYCWPFLAQPWMSPSPRPSRARVLHNRQMGSLSRASEEWQGTGSRLQTAVPTLTAHTGVGAVPTPGKAKTPGGRQPPLQRRSLFTGPRGILEEIIQPTHRKKAWSP